MLKVHIGMASMRQFQHVPTTYVHSINECFLTIKQVFLQISQLHCNEHVEMNKFLSSLAGTWMITIDSQFYIINSLS